MASSFQRLQKEILSSSLNGLWSLFSGFLGAADVLSLTPFFILHAVKESLPLSVAWIRPHAHLGNSEYIGLSQPGSTSAAKCDIHFMANQNNNPKNKHTHTKSNQEMANKEEMNSPRSLSRAPTSHEKLVIFLMQLTDSSVLSVRALSNFFMFQQLQHRKLKQCARGYTSH